MKTRIIIALLIGSMPFAGGASAAAQRGCVGAGAAVSSRNLPQIEHATLCLINAQRGARGLGRLHANRLLRRAALRHSREMVRKRYFDHTSPSGETFDYRIRQTGYLQGSQSWSLGENIAWGEGPYATPRSIVREWMNSPPHRHNILTPGFHSIGIGVAPGNPQSGTGGATYTTDFGSRE